MKRRKPTATTTKPQREQSALDLRRQAQQHHIAQLLLLGWTTTRIARKLHVTPRAIRYALDRPEFQTLFAELQQDHAQAVQRQLGHLLHGACDALEKMLRHSDWQARDAAIEKVLRVHGRYVERIDFGGQVRHVQGEPAPMDDAMREKARELLALQRGMLQKSLPDRFRRYEPDSDHHDERDPATGRYSPSSSNGHDEDEDA
jgi:hypothetical protein